MTELTAYTGPEPGAGLTANALIEWARAADAAHRLAETLSQTKFVPDHYQNRPGEATAAILYGAEIGLTPIAALRGIYIVKGKPGLYTDTKVGLLLAAGHALWVDKMTETAVTVSGHRAGTPDRVLTVTFTIEDAKRQGLTQTNRRYQSDPRGMLYARAAGILAARIAPDVLQGLTADDVPEPGPVGASTAIAGGAVTMQRRTPPEPEPERLRPALPVSEPSEPVTEPWPDPWPRDEHGPDRAPEPAPWPPPRPTDEPEPDESPTTGDDTGPQDPHSITDAQRARMHAAFREANMSREEYLAFVNRVLAVTPPHESTSTLSVAEASAVIDALATAREKGGNW